MKTATKYKRLTELKPEIITDKDITKYLFARGKGFYRYSCKRNAQNKPDKRIDIVGRFVFISNTVKQYYSIDKRYFFNHWDEYQSDCYAFIDYYHRRILIRCKDAIDHRKVIPIINRANESKFEVYLTPYEIKKDDISSTGEVNEWIYLQIDYLTKQFLEDNYRSIYRILNFTYNEEDILRNNALTLLCNFKNNPIIQNIIQICQKYDVKNSLRYNKIDTNRIVTIRLNKKAYIEVLLPTIIDIINNNILNKECYEYIMGFTNYHNRYKTKIKFEFYNDYIGTRGTDYFALNDDYSRFRRAGGLKNHINKICKINITKPVFTTITEGCANVEDSFKRIIEYIDYKSNEENGRN